MSQWTGPRPVGRAPQDPTGLLLYEPYYGLNEKPFSLSTDPRFLYKSAAHTPVFDDLLSAIRRREGLIVLTGEIGTGKTTLCRSVLGQLDRKTFSTFVPDPFVTREDLLKMLLVDFGVMSVEDLARGRLKGASRADMSYPLYDFLRSLAPLDAFAVLIIDEAQNLPLPLLEEVRILSDLEEGRKLLQVVLVGQPELTDALRLPRMRQVAQRVSSHCELKPMAREGVYGYVSHRLTVAGATPDRVHFTGDALDLIFDVSGGLPRVVNLLCDRALQHAHQVRSARIGAEFVRRAMADLRLASMAAPPAGGAPIAPPAALLDPSGAGTDVPVAVPVAALPIVAPVPPAVEPRLAPAVPAQTLPAATLPAPIAGFEAEVAAAPAVPATAGDASAGDDVGPAGEPAMRGAAAGSAPRGLFEKQGAAEAPSGPFADFSVLLSLPPTPSRIPSMEEQGREASRPASSRPRRAPGRRMPVAPAQRRSQAWALAALIVLGALTGVSVAVYWLWFGPVASERPVVPAVAPAAWRAGAPVHPVAPIRPRPAPPTAAPEASPAVVPASPPPAAPAVPSAAAPEPVPASAPAPVAVQTPAPTGRPQAAVTSSPLPSWAIQVGAFSRAERAAALVRQLTDGGLAAYQREADLGSRGRLHLVLVGPYATASDAAAALPDVRRMPDGGEAIVRPEGPRSLP